MKMFSEITKKNIFAISVGPLALVPALFGATFVYSLFGGGLASFFDAVLATLMVAMVGLLIAYPITIFFGMPALLILNRLGLLGLLPLLLVALIGAGGVALWLMPSLYGFLYFGYCGIAVAVGCWYAFKYF